MVDVWHSVYLYVWMEIYIFCAQLCSFWIWHMKKAIWHITCGMVVFSSLKTDFKELFVLYVQIGLRKKKWRKWASSGKMTGMMTTSMMTSLFSWERNWIPMMRRNDVSSSYRVSFLLSIRKQCLLSFFLIMKP